MDDVMVILNVTSLIVLHQDVTYKMTETGVMWFQIIADAT
jgi:hypothetical protein